MSHTSHAPVPQAVAKLHAHFRLQRLAVERDEASQTELADPDRPHCLMSRSQGDPSFCVVKEPVKAIQRSHSVMELAEIGYLASLERRTLHFQLSPKRGTALRSCQQRLAFSMLLLPVEWDARTPLPAYCLSRICEWTVRLYCERGRAFSDDGNASPHWLQRQGVKHGHFVPRQLMTHDSMGLAPQPFHAQVSSPSASSPSDPSADGSQMGELPLQSSLKVPPRRLAYTSEPAAGRTGSDDEDDADEWAFDLAALKNKKKQRKGHSPKSPQCSPKLPQWEQNHPRVQQDRLVQVRASILFTSPRYFVRYRTASPPQFDSHLPGIPLPLNVILRRTLCSFFGDPCGAEPDQAKGRGGATRIARAGTHEIFPDCKRRRAKQPRRIQRLWHELSEDYGGGARGGGGPPRCGVAREGCAEGGAER